MIAILGCYFACEEEEEEEKEGAGEGEQSENAPQTNETELQGTSNSSTCEIMTFH